MLLGMLDLAPQERLHERLYNPEEPQKAIAKELVLMGPVASVVGVESGQADGEGAPNSFVAR